MVVTGGSDGVAALKAWVVGDGNDRLVSEVDALNALKLEPKKHFVSLLLRLFLVIIMDDFVSFRAMFEEYFEADKMSLFGGISEDVEKR